MKFKDYKKIDDIGLASMICINLENKIILYGGTNFLELPPIGKKQNYNDIFVFDENFNLLETKKGILYPDRGILIKDDNKERFYYISGVNNSLITSYYFENESIKEEIIFDLGFEIIGGFGCYYNEKLYFGKKNLYEFDLKTFELNNKSKFIGDEREQSVYAKKDNYLYVLGGALQICYLDAFKYNLDNDKWIKIIDIPCSFTGSSSVVLDNKMIITGGFNKKVYDNAVKLLSSIEYKKEYFKADRSYFNWNDKIFEFDFDNEKFNVIDEDFNTARCSSSLIYLNNVLYLVMGEIKPGTRTPYVSRCNYER